MLDNLKLRINNSKSKCASIQAFTCTLKQNFYQFCKLLSTAKMSLFCYSLFCCCCECKEREEKREREKDEKKEKHFSGCIFFCQIYFVFSLIFLTFSFLWTWSVTWLLDWVIKIAQNNKAAVSIIGMYKWKNRLRRKMQESKTWDKILILMMIHGSRQRFPFFFKSKHTKWGKKWCQKISRICGKNEWGLSKSWQIDGRFFHHHHWCLWIFSSSSQHPNWM